MAIGTDAIGSAPIGSESGEGGGTGPPPDDPIVHFEATTGTTYDARALVRDEPEVVAPPSSVVFVKRVSIEMPTPTLDGATARPKDWVPTAESISNWGRLRIVVNGTDVTYFRGVVTEVRSWTAAEPFGDKSCELHFPQITPFEALPAWLPEWASVEIRLVRPDNSEKVLFEGSWASDEDGLDSGGSGFTMQVIGALFEADTHVKTPTINDGSKDVNQNSQHGTRDIGVLIRDALVERPLRLFPLTAPQGDPHITGIDSSERGSFNPLLSGYIQDLLSTAYSSPVLADGEVARDIETSPDGTGYWILGSLGTIIPFGELVAYNGSMLGIRLNELAGGMTSLPDSEGYWYVGADGGVFSFGASFYGGLGALGNPNDLVEIESTPSGLGYWLLDNIGGIFAYGDAPFEGSAASVSSTPVVDFVRTPSGHGYWILQSNGTIWPYGDATDYGNPFGTPDRVWCAIERSAGGAGYWVLNTLGEIYSYGDAVYHGGVTGTLNRPAVDMARSVGGAGYVIVAEDGGVFAFGDADYRGNGFDGNGAVHQWTVSQARRRLPYLRVKDRRHVQWTLACGAAGVTHDLSRDFTMSPNAVYGEGTDNDHAKWRNTKYPNNRQDVPVFSGSTLGVGTTSGDVLIWTREMASRGYPVDVGSTFTENTSSVTRRFQRDAGLLMSGKVNAQTWAATFGSYGSPDDLNNSYISALFSIPAVEPHIYAANGAVIGANPAYDPNRMRVERYENFGDGISKLQGQSWAQSEALKDQVPPYVGTIRLQTDPIEGSRFEIEPGDNLYFKYHRGITRRFHISDRSVDFQSGQVTLTVDERARDSMTVASILQRDRSSVQPARRRTARNKQSTVVEDTKAVFDVESGAGVIPRHAIAHNLWNVIRIAAGEFGSIVRAEFTTETPAAVAIGVFDQYVNPALLLGHGSSPFNAGYWDDFPEDSGLIIAWGGAGQAGGYFPGAQSDGGSLTGRTVDNSSWEFLSTQPPWLWIAEWYDGSGTGYISGLLSPAPADR